MDLRQAVDEIKDRLNIVDILSEYVELKKAGQNFKALCPFHTEKTPSFIVNPSKQIFHCFGCGTGGDLITFVMRYEGLTFADVVKSLSERVGIRLESIPPDQSSGTNLRRGLLEIHKSAALFYHKELNHNGRAKGYLKKRGVSDDMIEEFFLGYAPRKGDSILRHLKEEGFTEDLIQASGLIKATERGESDTFRDRIVFPITNSRGSVIAFGGRTMEKDSLGPKYLNSPETLIFKKSSELFGLNLSKAEINKKGYAIIMEGYLDVITSHQYGIKNAVAPLGTALTEGQLKRLRPFTKRLLLVFDSDESGINASRKAMSLIYENGFTGKVLFLPQGDDPDTFLRREGAEAFRALFKNVLGLVDFRLALEGERVDIVRDLIFIISKITDSIMRGDLIRETSEKTGLSEQFLMEELSALRKGNEKSPAAPEKDIASLEFHLLGLYLSYPQYRKTIKSGVSLDDFEDRGLREIFNRLFSSPDSDLGDINSGLDERERSLITEAMIRLNIDSDEVERNITDCIERLRYRRMAAIRKGIEMEIRIAEKRGKGETVKRLQEKLNSLIRGR